MNISDVRQCAPSETAMPPLFFGSGYGVAWVHELVEGEVRLESAGGLGIGERVHRNYSPGRNLLRLKQPRERPVLDKIAPA